jgi:hypothetical protein
MSTLHEAALEALIATSSYRLLFINNIPLSKCYSAIFNADHALKDALKIGCTFDRDALDACADPVALAGSIAVILAKSDETAQLASAIKQALGVHRLASEAAKIAAE